MSNAVEFNHVWKKFKRGEKFNSLRDAVPNFMNRLLKKENIDHLKEQEFWAVKDVNFTIPKGGVVGVMGPNGAGKSTILKLLSGIMTPTKGKMTINGRLSALIEVTAGFHPELTGRENVYLNATILGMKRKEIDRKFNEIVEFSGVEDFIDTPVKRYSSGMYSRLGFSVAAHMDPEILIVDEVLSVGDVSFQAKCAQKMRDLLNSGATILLVSHQIALIQSLCKRVILLDHGQLVKDGPTEEVLPYYQNITFKKSEDEIKRKSSQADGQANLKKNLLIEIKNVEIAGNNAEIKEEFTIGEPLNITVNYQAKENIKNPIIIINITRSDGVLCCSLNSREQGIIVNQIHDAGTFEIRLGEINLASGVYLLNISIWDREMIHPYVTRSKDIIKITAMNSTGLNKAVFLPKAEWKISR